ncbi:translation initiation factor 3, RNA-binding subunit [Basidiobolus meristosporus CBS 931.73]|uniref:Eukaryotic translation initiation factor 3 subunit G n=1 Tax=Basidiobolus meristosporus CBS 931.73 TaxID=1314790 RepID=A0A1Y1YEV3_9FUNG|nr:translation initiation factor 3, RNA-binding subunit [Basidiobolus meristosporus CBS 931.73]|eukprot:ORX96570.1 translation initiation factor 3, RNA-binding subunit [Basidiobolus meristosporus CBS 931.73]
MAALNETKASWADEVGEELDNQFDDDGIKTIVDIQIREDGKKVKITRKIQKKLITENVNHTVALRKKWAKFGQEKGNKPGPDMSTTTVGEQIFLRLSSGNQIVETEDPDAKLKEQLKGKKILCRICKGDHFTLKCPYKDTLKPLDELTSALNESKTAATEATAPVEAAAPSRYIPPALRAKMAGGNAASTDDRDKRDEAPTLRVTNLSEDTVESDIYDLFRPFGHIARVYLARDRETNICKGFSFVSFSSREDASRALEAVDGHGFDNLILHVEWAKSSK